MIKIGNIRTYKKDNSIPIKIDRSSVLGNPFYMQNESKRDFVCEQYETYFKDKIKNNDVYFINELNRIYEICIKNDVTLLCWCSPKRCHGETIKRYIDEKIKEHKNE